MSFFKNLFGLGLGLGLGKRARSGERCPASGVWRAMTTPSTTVSLAEGSNMPTFSGKSVNWLLTKHK